MKIPPRWLQGLLEYCCPQDRMDILGDFEEWYQELCEERSRISANLVLFLQSLSMLKLKVSSRSKSKTYFIMSGLHLKIAKRHLLKNKLYAGINCLGLAIGVSVCALIGLFIQFELSYDRHFENYDQVYRVAGSYDQGGNDVTISTMVPFLLQPAMQNNLGGEIVYTRMDFLNLSAKVAEQSFWEDHAVAVDSTFFEVFGMSFLSGDARTALDHPSGLVIDESTAFKYFNDNEVIGRSVEIYGDRYEITGVVRDLPPNTHFDGNLFLPISSLVDGYPYWMTDTYGGVSHRQYIKAPRGFHAASFEAGLNELIASYVDREPPTYFLQPLQDIHLKSHLVGELKANGSYSTIYIFLAVATMILLLACINFINLSIAGSFQRLKEVGVKKVMGATRGSQIRQFQMEALIVSSIASVIAILLVEALLPLFNQVTGIDFTITWQQDLQILGLCFSLLLIVSVLAGSFPPLFLLRLPTLKSLTQSMVTTSPSKINPRSLLVGIQFFIAAIIISSTLIVLRQLTFMQTKDLGIDIDQLVIVPFQSAEALGRYETLKSDLEQQSFVKSITATTNGLSTRVASWRQYRKSQTTENVNIPTVVVGHDYFETIDANFVAGRGYKKEFPSDYTEAFVINEEAARFLELEDPIGAQLIGSAFTGSEWNRKEAKIIGVVEDFHFASMHNKIRPVVFSLSSDITYPLQMMYIKLSTADLASSMESIEVIWNEVNAGTPFRYRIVKEAFNEQYAQDVQFLQVFSSFAGLSIIIGCLGLFGLTAFVMRRRTKEIGIRKVLGASQWGLLRILSLDFMKLVMIASLLGIPITSWFMLKWLENFEYRVSLEWGVFLVTVGAVIFSSFFTILYHSLKVAGTNPVESIKYE